MQMAVESEKQNIPDAIRWMLALLDFINVFTCMQIILRHP